MSAVRPGPIICWAPCLALAWLVGCSIDPNYLDPEGPRYAGDHTAGDPELGDRLHVVSYNLRAGLEVETAIAALRSQQLAGADFVLMQEMDPGGVDEIAAALELRYVYYPASVKDGRDWGNAVLSRWPLLDDRKILLPWADPFSNTRRIAVTARVDLASAGELQVYSTHIATASLGLGARLDQVETILDDADAAAVAVIGGDLNTSDPGSVDQTHELFAEHGFAWASDDATGTSSALGFELTLDYVYARELAPEASGTFRGESGSDHQPIWVALGNP
jgi:endonuclease/exonuclease/phosphatase family metal-dependent hydrolase